MALPIIVAPVATFVVFVLIAIGLYTLLEQPRAVARGRVAAFASSGSNGSGPVAAGSLLLTPQRFSNIASLQWFLQQRHWGTRLSEDLARAGIQLRPGEYLLIRCLLAFVFTLGLCAAGLPFVLAALVGLVSSAAPVPYVLWRQRQRQRAFEDQLVDALVLIANGLKAGFSFLQAMQAVADEMTDPISSEFRQALIEARMGEAVDEALMKIVPRVGSADFELVATSMVIQRQVGGNLTEIIDNVCHTVRERHRIRREVRTLTGEQRMSGWILGVLPVALLVVLMFLNPSYLSGMWAATSGKLLLAAGFFMDVAGLLVIRSLVNIEV